MDSPNLITGMIQEGLIRGDLDQLVLPLLTIDQYASKISDKTNIVVGFYCMEEDAAHDLSNFIERSPYFIQDTDVSPAPTKDGYYMTFVEMSRTPDFVSALISLLDEVNRLTNVDNWQFQSAKTEKNDILDVNEKNLETYVNTKVPDADAEKIQEILNFFRHSSLNSVTVEKDQLLLEKHGLTQCFHIVSFGTDVPYGIFQLDETTVSTGRALERFLCGPYGVHKIDHTWILECEFHNQILSLRSPEE
jgi:hypothetical protein